VGPNHIEDWPSGVVYKVYSLDVRHGLVVKCSNLAMDGELIQDVLNQLHVMNISRPSPAVLVFTALTLQYTVYCCQCKLKYEKQGMLRNRASTHYQVQSQTVTLLHVKRKINQMD